MATIIPVGGTASSGEVVSLAGVVAAQAAQVSADAAAVAGAKVDAVADAAAADAARIAAQGAQAGAEAAQAAAESAAQLYPSGEYATETVASAGPGPGALDMGVVAQTVAKLRAVVPLDAGIDYLECGSTVGGAILLVQNAQDAVTVAVRAADGYTSASGPGDLDLAPGKWLALVWSGTTMTAYGNGSGSGYEALAAIPLAAINADAADADAARLAAESDAASATAAKNAAEADAALALAAKNAAEAYAALALAAKGDAQDDAALALASRTAAQSDAGLAWTARTAAQADAATAAATVAGLTVAPPASVATASQVVKGDDLRLRNATDTYVGVVMLATKEKQALGIDDASALTPRSISGVRVVTNMGVSNTLSGTGRIGTVDAGGVVYFYPQTDATTWVEARCFWGTGNINNWPGQFSVRTDKPFLCRFDGVRIANATSTTNSELWLMVGSPVALATAPNQFTTGSNGFGFKLTATGNGSGASGMSITPFWFSSATATGAPTMGSTVTFTNNVDQVSVYGPIHPFVNYDGAGVFTFGYTLNGTRVVMQTSTAVATSTYMSTLFAIQCKHTSGSTYDALWAVSKTSRIAYPY